MKCVYQEFVLATVELNNGDFFTTSIYMSNYKYGERPKDTKYYKDNTDDSTEIAFVALSLFNATYYSHCTVRDVIHTPLFRKEKYVFFKANDEVYARKIFKSQLKLFTEEHHYILIPIEEINITQLQNKLSFSEYTQLIFDREKDLKRLWKKKGNKQQRNIIQTGSNDECLTLD